MTRRAAPRTRDRTRHPPSRSHPGDRRAHASRFTRASRHEPRPGSVGRWWLVVRGPAVLLPTTSHHPPTYTEDSRCPSLSFFVFRYLRVESLAGISKATASETDNPYPCSPTNFRGLLVRSRIVLTPRSLRICAPMP